MLKWQRCDRAYMLRLQNKQGGGFMEEEEEANLEHREVAALGENCLFF